MARNLNALDLLRRDHARLHPLFRRFQRSDALDEQRELCGTCWRSCA